MHIIILTSSWNSQESSSEFQWHYQNYVFVPISTLYLTAAREDIFLQYYMHSDLHSNLKFPTTSYSATYIERVNGKIDEDSSDNVRVVI